MIASTMLESSAGLLLVPRTELFANVSSLKKTLARSLASAVPLSLAFLRQESSCGIVILTSYPGTSSTYVFPS